MEENAKRTVVIPGTRFEGKITGTSDVRIEGEFSGEVDLEATLVVAPSGKTDALLKAKNILLEGEHVGDVSASNLIQVSPEGRVKGVLKAPEISIEKGARFSGQIDMTMD